MCEEHPNTESYTDGRVLSHRHKKKEKKWRRLMSTVALWMVSALAFITQETIYEIKQKQWRYSSSVPQRSKCLSVFQATKWMFWRIGLSKYCQAPKTEIKGIQWKKPLNLIYAFVFSNLVCKNMTSKLLWMPLRFEIYDWGDFLVNKSLNFSLLIIKFHRPEI